MRYHLHAQVTVSAYTIVEADSPEEAMEIATGRDVVLHFNGSGTNPGDEWCIDDADGEPVNMRIEKD